MYNINTILSCKRAGALACFFLFQFFPAPANDLIWKFDPALQKVYISVLNLDKEEAYLALNKLDTRTNAYHKLYVQSLCETLDALISEDEEKFKKIDEAFKARFKFLDSEEESAETLFLKAELNLQRGFNLLNLGHEFNAVWAIRSAYNYTQECLAKYPNFVPIKKTSGVIQVMVGSVPENYRWFMSLLGMKGSVEVGQKQFQDLQNSSSSLSMEATILYYTIKGLINQQYEEATKGILESLEAQPFNRLALFLGVNMLMKNAQSEQALKLIETLDTYPQGLPMYYIEYLRGEILLQKGEYEKSIAAYRNFIAHYKSDNFKKDSYYKIALGYWFQRKTQLAYQHLEMARKTGKNVVPPDRYADFAIRENKFPNTKLYKLRLFTDGGYFEEAKNTLQDICPVDLKTNKDKAEYAYRKARLADKLNDPITAETFYLKAIQLTGENPWYFAPNAALQLGYLEKSRKAYSNAKKYFEMALSYKQHEYKNSIDSKAKAALEQLENR